MRKFWFIDTTFFKSQSSSAVDYGGGYGANGKTMVSGRKAIIISVQSHKSGVRNGSELFVVLTQETVFWFAKL